jgi:hypothetical protein
MMLQRWTRYLVSFGTTEEQARIGAMFLIGSLWFGGISCIVIGLLAATRKDADFWTLIAIGGAEFIMLAFVGPLSGVATRSPRSRRLFYGLLVGLFGLGVAAALANAVLGTAIAFVFAMAVPLAFSLRGARMTRRSQPG